MERIFRTKWYELNANQFAILWGTLGDDVLDAPSEDFAVFGLSGADTLTSVYNRTALFGGWGADTFDTSIFFDDTGNDPSEVRVAQSGGAGNDTMTVAIDTTSSTTVQTVETLVSGGQGDDVINVGAAIKNDYTLGVTNIVIGGLGDDTISASAKANTARNVIFAGHGNDAVNADISLNDLGGHGINGNSGTNEIWAGTGDDTVIVTSFGSSFLNVNLVTTIYGQAGDDDIQAYSSTNSNSIGSLARHMLDGGAGNDVMLGVHTNAGADISANQSNEMYGRSGHDIMTASITPTYAEVGFIGHNLLDGGTGSDQLTADIDTSSSSGVLDPVAVNDLYGRSGADILSASIVAADFGSDIEARNNLNGGAGNDVITASIATINYNSGPGTLAENALYGQAGNDQMTATLSVEANPFGTILARNHLDGGDGNDVIIGVVVAGTVGRSEVYGGSGDDWIETHGGQANHLYGGAGNDTLNGSDFDDTLKGGEGDDEVNGRLGADTLVFDPLRFEGTDIMYGFDGSEDRLLFENVFDSGAPGLADDLDAISWFSDDGVDVTVNLVSGTVLIFMGIGTGTTASFADLVDDPATQLLGADSGLLLA